MLNITTKLELPIAHSLQGAYTGLCVGNVSRDGNKVFSLEDGLIPIIHGHNYVVTISISSTADNLDKDGMIMDFKLLKKTLHEYFDKYDHSMILHKNHPLVKVYKENYEREGISLDDTRLFVWKVNPTAENMSLIWQKDLYRIFNKLLKGIVIKVSVEETSNNLITAD